MKRSLTGIKPTGDPHIGNYFGMLRPAIQRQEKYECLYFIADMHSLTTQDDPKLIRKNTYDLTAMWLAGGLDTSSNMVYRQSDLPICAEFSWYLSCVTGLGLLLKAHAYKDAQEKSIEINHGVLYYPVLMASDIILYDADIVPVGKDQKQHVEMARDMAGSFNSIYGPGLMKLPEPIVEEATMIVPGLDGRKMSKSYGNQIPLFEDEKVIRKKVLAIVTDSTPLEASKSMIGTPLADLFKLFATPDEFQSLENRLNQGGLGWGHAKEELYQAVMREISGLREKYFELRNDEATLEKILQSGADRAFQIAQPVLNRVRKAVGFRELGFSKV